MKKTYILPIIRVLTIAPARFIAGSTLSGENPSVEVTNIDDGYDGEFSSRKGRNSIWDDEE